MKWLPWIVAAAAAWFLLNYCSKPAAFATKAVAGAAVDATKTAAGTTVDAAQAVANLIPTGAGALTKMINGLPTLNVYFDTGKTELSPEWAAKSADIVNYLKDNAAAKAVVSGFHVRQATRQRTKSYRKTEPKLLQLPLASQAFRQIAS